MDNKVELIGFYGSDLSHALSAWTSTSRDLTDNKKERIPKLLAMLASEGHHTPFEKSTFHFLIEVEQATHIQILKHRIGISANAESARYKELTEDKIYIPSDWPDKWQDKLMQESKRQLDIYHQALTELEPIVGRKRAKESARFFRPFNSQLKMDVMFNFRSFYHFYNLRAKDNAQVEVHALADKMLSLIKETGKFKHTIAAFGLLG